MTDPLVFDEAFMHKLERLSLVVRKAKRGHFKGERRSRQRGQSVEFADYRNYVRGDDLRALDWNVYARLERPFIKLFEEEVDQTVHILIDTSASMDWPLQTGGVLGLPQTQNKWIYARQLAAALAYIALSNQDRLFVVGLTEAQFTLWGPDRRRQRIHQLLAFLSEHDTAPTVDLNVALTRYAQYAKRPGLLFIISDFLTGDDYQTGFSNLQSRGHELAVLHLLSPDEVTPTLGGDLQLLDVETGHKQDVSINATMKKLYQQKFAEWQGAINQFCGKRNIPYALVSTEHPFEALILQVLRQRGFVR